MREFFCQFKQRRIHSNRMFWFWHSTKVSRSLVKVIQCNQMRFFFVIRQNWQFECLFHKQAVPRVMEFLILKMFRCHLEKAFDAKNPNFVWNEKTRIRWSTSTSMQVTKDPPRKFRLNPEYKNTVIISRPENRLLSTRYGTQCCGRLS